MRTVFMIIISVSLCRSLVASQYENNEEPVTYEGVDYEDIRFRVVNGRPATPGEIPYQVSFKKYKRYAYINYCGGSVIGLTKILTAGHCFAYQKNICEKACGIYHIKNLQKIYAVAGTVRTVGYYTNDPTSTEQWRTLRRAAIPEGFAFPRHDICVVFTYSPFVINQYVKIMPLASRSMDYGSIQCVASGYGRINHWITSDSLLWAYLTLIPSAQCSLIHRQNMRDYICTSSVQANVLQGDSGGGLVCKNTGDPQDQGQGVIVGVVSGAAVKKWGGYKTFFTRVTSYRKFIDNRGTINSPILYLVWLAPIISISWYS